MSYVQLLVITLVDFLVLYMPKVTMTYLMNMSLIYAPTLPIWTLIYAPTAYDRLSSTYATASNLAIPTRLNKECKRSNSKWFNESLRSLTKNKYQLHCKIRASPSNQELKSEFREVCKQVKIGVRKSILKFEITIVKDSKNQPKILYSYINGQKACNESIKGLVDADGIF